MTRLYILEMNINHPVCLSARCEEAAWQRRAAFLE
jgi:hypothetical protein